MRPIIARSWPVERALPVAGRRRQPPDPPIRVDQVDRAPPVASAARRPRTFRFPVAPPRARVDRRAARPRPPHRRDLCHDLARHRLDRHPRHTPRNGTARAHLRPPGADPGRAQRRLPPGLPRPAVPVPEHRPRPDRPSHRVLRPRRARRRADHLSDPPVSTRPARRRGGHRHHQSRNLGPPPHGHPRRPLGLARHRARLPRPPAGESPPPGLLRTPRIPRRPRPPARPVAGHPRPRLLLRLAQERDPRPHLGRDRRGRRRHPALAGPLEDLGGADSPDLTTRSPRPWRDGGHAATPTARSSSTATASPSAAGARRGAPPVRRPACRPASSTIAAAPPPAT